MSETLESLGDSSGELPGRAPLTVAPWVIRDDGWLVCLMCPMARETRDGRIYYRGINARKKTRRQVRRWVLTHRRCGFLYLML